eukprot:1821848-Rhodomonas_salina.1
MMLPLATRRAVLTTAYGAIDCYAKSGTDIPYADERSEPTGRAPTAHAHVTRARYQPSRFLRDVRVWCYALAVQYPVLTQRMVLPEDYGAGHVDSSIDLVAPYPSSYAVSGTGIHYATPWY